MRYYKDKYTCPTWNWLMVSEKGFDLSYLLEKRKKVNSNQYNKLYKSHMDIFLSLEDTNTELYSKYLEWKSLLLQFNAEQIRKSNVIIKDLERTFREYLLLLEKYYKDFNITEYYLNPDYKKIYKDLFKDTRALKHINELDNFKDIRFYDWFEYNIFIQKYLNILVLTVRNEFKEKFILKREITIQSLIELDSHLSDIYVQNKAYNSYQFKRWELFNMNDLSSNRKQQYSEFDEVEMYSDIKGTEFDTRRPLVEYEAFKKDAKRIAKRQEEMNKPQADGTNRI